MNKQVQVYNSLHRKKEIFEPIDAPFVGMYLCGPTVYGDPHLGHARSALTFDLVFRYLTHLGFKVRYVRNITDVGHLENDGDEGDDKIAKKARLDKLEPMEIVQRYTLSYRKAMDALNCLPPSIEPTATGHIIEQIGITEKILENGYAYEVNGSVYFDVMKYAENNNYGELSGKILEDLMAGSRTLDGQDEKRSAVDFALWKKASENHIMKWPSPWSIGFPGWHLECSAMSTKYLGKTFDIHGGGMDLQFPHHEAEIAQNVGSCGAHPAKYWMHNNMLTIDGQKMSKSIGNFITIHEMFEGNHPRLEKAYSPMNLRFFMLQAHYRSTLDFSNEALQAAEKGMKRLHNSLQIINSIEHAGGVGNEAGNAQAESLCEQLYTEMNDDFNTAKVIAVLFEISSKLQAYKNKQADANELSAEIFAKLKNTFSKFIIDVLGIIPEENSSTEKLNEVVEMLIALRKEARENKDYALSDKIRNNLAALEILLKDEKGGATTFTIN